MTDTATAPDPDAPPCRTGCPLCAGGPTLSGAMRWRPTTEHEAEVFLATWAP